MTCNYFYDKAANLHDYFWWWWSEAWRTDSRWSEPIGIILIDRVILCIPVEVDAAFVAQRVAREELPAVESVVIAVPQQEHLVAVEVPIPPLRPHPIIQVVLPVMHTLHPEPARQVRDVRASVRIEPLAGVVVAVIERTIWPCGQDSGRAIYSLLITLNTGLFRFALSQ